MALSFERCVGPHRDVRELEYVCALQQTQKSDLRSTATVTAEDVVAYLRSRHGLEVNLNYLNEVFMPGLAGALGSSNALSSDGTGMSIPGGGDPVFDIVELTTILLIPHFKRQARYYRLNKNIISRNTRLIGANSNPGQANLNNNRGVSRRGGVLAEVANEHDNYANSSNGTGQTTVMTVVPEEEEEEEGDEEEFSDAREQESDESELQPPLRSPHGHLAIEDGPDESLTSEVPSVFENEPIPEENPKPMNSKRPSSMWKPAGNSNLGERQRSTQTITWTRSNGLSPSQDIDLPTVGSGGSAGTSTGRGSMTSQQSENDDQGYTPGRARRQRLERRNRRAALKAAAESDGNGGGSLINPNSTRNRTGSGKKKEDFFQALYNIVIRDLEIEGRIPSSSSNNTVSATATQSASTASAYYSAVWGNKETNTGSVTGQSIRQKTHHNRRDVFLTPDLMRSILEIYGEGNGVTDRDIQSMLDAATPSPRHGGAGGRVAGATTNNNNNAPLLFTPESLARACTADLEHYKVGWEDRDSTHFDDVFKGTYLDQTGDFNHQIASMMTHKQKKKKKKNKSRDYDPSLMDRGNLTAADFSLQDDSLSGHDPSTALRESDATTARTSTAIRRRDGNSLGASAASIPYNRGTSYLDGSVFSLGSEMEEKADIQKIKTWASIDGIAENYRSIFFSVVIWIALLVLYWAYVYGENDNMALNVIRLNCTSLTSIDEDTGEEKTTWASFFCQVGDDVIQWVLILLQLATYGSIFIVMGSAGNSIYAKHDLRSVIHLLAGMAFIYFVCIVSYLVEHENEGLGFNTKRDGQRVYDLDETTGALIIALGIILMSFQLKTLLAIGLPRSWYKDMPWVQEALVSDMGGREGKTKQAARFKVDKLVKNALAMHKSSSSIMVRNSTITQKTIRNLGNGWEGGNPLLAFATLADERESVGGIKWTIKKMWDGTLFEEEGVWLHARLWACNSVQVLVIIWFSIILPYFFWITFLKEEDSVLDNALDSIWNQTLAAAAPYWEPYVEAFVDNFNQFNTSLQDTLWNNTNTTQVSEFASEILKAVNNETLYSTLAELDLSTLLQVADISTMLLDQAGFTRQRRRKLLEESDEFESDDYFQYYNNQAYGYYNRAQEYYNNAKDSIDEQKEYWVPEDWQLMVPFIVGSVAAVTITCYLAVVWIPSSVCTILRFRSGHIGSIRDKDFYKYREQLDQISLLLGSVFWGSVYSGFLLFGTFGFVTFLFFYEPSQTFMINFASTLIAITLTLTLRVLLLMCISGLFSGFYRKNVAWSSFFMVVLECWSLGTTVFTLVIRLVLMILLAASYVGRLDAAVFAKGVDSVAFRLLEDRYPLLIRKDILIHEAHRHPFIERLGTIYMLKLKHGDEFGRAPESAWRMVLTLALMPWLRKFRYDEDEYDLNGNLKEDSTYMMRRDSLLHPRRESSVHASTTRFDEMAALRQRVSILERQNAFLLNETEDRAAEGSQLNEGPSFNEDPSFNQSFSNQHVRRRASRHDPAPDQMEFDNVAEC